MINVSSTNYFTQYQRLRRTDVTISSKSLFILRVTPLKEGDTNQVTLTSIYIFFIETAKPPPGAMCNFIIDREVTFFFEIA